MAVLYLFYFPLFLPETVTLCETPHGALASSLVNWSVSQLLHGPLQALEVCDLALRVVRGQVHLPWFSCWEQVPIWS